MQQIKKRNSKISRAHYCYISLIQRKKMRSAENCRSTGPKTKVGRKGTYPFIQFSTNIMSNYICMKTTMVQITINCITTQNCILVSTFSIFKKRQLILSTELLQNIVLTAFCQTCFHARINFSWKCRNRFVDDAELIQYFAFQKE